ncbi:hypothetical protein FACS1894181_05560 [Bacteroidia bacterium]|nr:hypothetical protein FACS1894181_05560 [Bacteroidia bacterium]
MQWDLDRFFKELGQSDFNIRAAAKGALSTARSKLNPEAFKRLNTAGVNTFHRDADYSLWGNYRVLAVDGTRLALPNHPSIKEEPGGHSSGPDAGSKRSLAIGSLLYDALNKATLDSQLAPCSSSESALLQLHLEHAGAGGLLLLDRGHPGFWLLFLLQAKGIGFCVRLKDNWWLKVKDFAGSGEKEGATTFRLPWKDRSKLSGYPDYQQAGKGIVCRLAKVELPDGKKEILCTSLLCTAGCLAEDFSGLYRYRRGEGEVCKRLKCRIELEDFSGKTAIPVKQDFHAKVFLMSLCSIYAHPIDEKAREEYKADENRKHPRQINRTNALSMTQEILASVFLKHRFGIALEAFDRIVEKTREVIRPGRSVERNKKPKKLFSMNYKKL